MSRVTLAQWQMLAAVVDHGGFAWLPETRITGALESGALDRERLTGRGIFQRA